MRTYLIVAFLLSASVAQAQRIVEKTTAWQPGQEVLLDLKYARTIRINTGERDEVSVRVSVSVNDNTQNEAWSMTTDVATDQIRVVSHLDPPQGDYSGDCPGSSYHLYEGRYCSLIDYEIDLPRAASFHAGR